MQDPPQPVVTSDATLASEQVALLIVMKQIAAATINATSVRRRNAARPIVIARSFAAMTEHFTTATNRVGTRAINAQALLVPPAKIRAWRAAPAVISPAPVDATKMPALELTWRFVKAVKQSSTLAAPVHTATTRATRQAAIAITRVTAFAPMPCAPTTLIATTAHQVATPKDSSASVVPTDVAAVADRAHLHSPA